MAAAFGAADGMRAAAAVYMAAMAATIVLFCTKAKSDNNSEEI